MWRTTTHAAKSGSQKRAIEANQGGRVSVCMALAAAPAKTKSPEQKEIIVDDGPQLPEKSAVAQDVDASVQSLLPIENRGSDANMLSHRVMLKVMAVYATSRQVLRPAFRD